MLTDLERRIKKLNEIDIPVALQNLMIENEGIILETLRFQLSGGKTGDNTDTTLFGVPEYAPSTIRYKRQFGLGLGAETSHVTLFMLGEFYERMFLDVKRGVFSIKSEVPYFDKIVERSGENVMKLNKENMDSIFENFIQPELEKIVNDAINGL